MKSKFNKNSIYVILILVIFIVSFYFVSYIYTLNSRKNRTIVLEKSLFNSNLPNGKAEELRVENVSKLDTNYIFFDINVLDNDTIIFKTLDKNNNEKISMLDIDNNKLTEIYKKDSGDFNHLAISEDGKKIIYSDFIKEINNRKTYLYDVNTKQNTEVITNGSYANLIINNNKYIGVDDNDLFIKDLITGEVNNLAPATIKGITQTSAPKAKEMYSLKSSQDENTVYCIYQGIKPISTETKARILKINLQNKETSEDIIEGTVYDLIPLNDGNFIFTGNIQGTDGIFIYNVKGKSYKNLKQGNINNIGITEDNKKIAYNISDNNGVSELHAALFNKDKIEADTTVYSNARYGNSLKWSKDGKRLFYFTGYNGGSTIYRFSFKE